MRMKWNSTFNQLAVTTSLLFCLLPHTADAQAPDGGWERIGSITFTALARQSPSTITAATSHGYIYYSRDDGQTWKHQFLSDTLDLVDIAWVDSLHGAMLEKSNSVFFTDDGGVTWERSLLPLRNGEGIDLMARLSYPSVDTLFACDWVGRIFRTTDQGESWSSYQTPDSIGQYPAGLNALYFLNSKIGFCAGDFGTFFSTNDAGMTWTKVALPEAGDSVNLYCIDFHGRDTGVIGGFGYTWATTDGGNSWTFHPLPVEAFADVHVIKLLNDSEFFALGPASQSYFSTNLGQNIEWALTGEQANPIPYIHGALFDPAHGATIVGDNGLVLHSEDGKAWSFINDCPFNGMGFQTIGQNIFLSGGSAVGLFVKSTDGGFSWRTVTVPEVSLENLAGFPIHFSSLDSGLLFSVQGFTLETSDGGLSWDSLGRNPGFSAVSFAGNTGFGEDGSGMDASVTHDAGRSWTRIKIPKDSISPYPKAFPFSSALLSPFALDTLYGFMLCAYIDIDTSGGVNSYYFHDEVYRTTDGGSSWSKWSQAPSFHIKSIFFLSRDVGFLGTDSGRIYKTRNGGNSWESIQLATDNPIDGIQFLNDTLGFASGSNHFGDRHLNLFTTDGGKIWIPDTVRFPAYDGGGGYPLGGFSFLDSATIIATSGTSLFKRSWPPATSSESVRTALGWNPGVFLWVDNYPNPATNHLRIRLSGMWSNSGAPLTAGMLDLLGRKVLDLTNLANLGNNGNTSDFDVDVSALPAGVYMVHYTLGGYSYGRPVVIIH